MPPAAAMRASVASVLRLHGALDEGQGPLTKQQKQAAVRRSGVL